MQSKRVYWELLSSDWPLLEFLVTAVFCTTFLCLLGIVVYFDQSLGAAHSKRWLKSAFMCFLKVFDAKMMFSKNEAKMCIF